MKNDVLTSAIVNEIIAGEKLGYNSENKIWHKNISNIRKSGLQFYLSDVEVIEYNLCANDVIHFAKFYCNKIKNIEFNLHQYQKEVLELYNDENDVILNISRQMDKYYINAIYILWYTLFHNDKTIMFHTIDSVSAKNLIVKVKEIYSNLPFYLKQGIIIFGEKNISFENGSRIKTRYGGNVAEIYSHIDILFLDEFSKHDNPHRLYGCYKPLMTEINSKMIINSTPNGDDFYKELYYSNRFKVKDVKWSDFPKRRDTILYLKPEVDINTVLKHLKEYTSYETYIDSSINEKHIRIAYKENVAGYNLIKFFININTTLKEYISEIWNWKEYETCCIGGTNMFKQEYDVEFIEQKIEVSYTNEKDFKIEYIDVDKKLYDIAEALNQFIVEKYSVIELPILLSDDKKSLLIGLNLAHNKVDKECCKNFYRIKVEKYE